MLYRRLRYLFRLYWAILVKYRIWILLSIITIILSFSLPKTLIHLMPPIRNTQKIGLVGRSNITNLPLIIQKKISLGLTSLDPLGNPVSGLASSWQATESGLLYQFFLDPKAKWSDGKPISSKDFVLNFSDADVSFPSDHQINIKLQKFPYSPLPVLVSKPLFKKNPFIGAGVYKVKNFHQRSDSLTQLKLVPTDNKSPLPVLDYYFYSSSNQAMTALKLGDINSLESVSDISSLRDWKIFSITQYPNYEKLTSLVFNYKGKYFTGPAGRNFRLALNYALDRIDYQYPANGPIPPNSWAFSEKIKGYNFDPDKSSALFKKIENPPSELTLHTFPGFIEAAEKIKSDWKKLGLNVNIISVTEVPSDFEVLLIPLPLFSDPDQYHLWHSKSETQNYGSFNNPRIDLLLEQGRREFDFSKRKAIYDDFQKYLLDESPAIFLYYPVNYTVSRK